MMMFRPQRGSLQESMKERVYLSDRNALLVHLGTAPADRVEVEPYGYDDRICWDTHIVTVNGIAVGFTDGPL